MVKNPNVNSTCPEVNATWPHSWYINICSGHGLVPTGNKPWPESIVTRFKVGWMNEFTQWGLKRHVPFWHMTRERERERDIKFIGLFEDRGHRGPYSPYKPFNHNLYIGIIIFPHIDNPQSTGYNWPKKKTIKIINEKSEGPIYLTNHWRKRLWISLHVDLKRLN